MGDGRMDSDRVQAETRYAISGYVWRWQFGMGNQAQRALQPGSADDHEIDAHFFAVSLLNLRAAVRWGRDYCDRHRDSSRVSRFDRALKDFDDAVPHLKPVRDIQEHFVDYESGSERGISTFHHPSQSGGRPVTTQSS